MKRTLRIASILLLLATAVAAYVVAVVGTGEKLSAPAADEAQASFLTPAAAETLALYSPPETAAQKRRAEDASAAHRRLARARGRSNEVTRRMLFSGSRAPAPDG